MGVVGVVVVVVVVDPVVVLVDPVVVLVVVLVDPVVVLVVVLVDPVVVLVVLGGDVARPELVVEPPVLDVVELRLGRRGVGPWLTSAGSRGGVSVDLGVRPKGAAWRGAAGGPTNGSRGEPAWLAPSASRAMKAATDPDTAPTDVRSTGFATAATRSRRRSVRRRRSSSGGREPRWSSHDMSGAEA